MDKIKLSVPWPATMAPERWTDEQWHQAATDGVKRQAVVLSTYRQALCDGGFTPDQVFELVRLHAEQMGRTVGG